MSLLQLERVCRSFPSPDGPPLEVIRELDLAIEDGESLAIVGPSGSGKSTLLHLIGGLDRPTSGRVLLEDLDLATLSDDDLAMVRSFEFGFVFQAHHLLPQCTVLENVLLPTLARADTRTWEARRQQAGELLERVGLAERAGHRPAQLSGGECQRAAVARALINGAKLLLADEPTGSLDAATSERIAELLCEINREDGVTLVVVTHWLELAGRMGRRLELVR